MPKRIPQHRSDGTPATAVAELGIKLHVVTLPDAGKSFVLLLRRWMVERCFAWASRFRRWGR